MSSVLHTEPEAEEAVPVLAVVPADPSAVCVVVPAYNESESIVDVVVQARRAIPAARIVIVDDASLDDTGRRAAAAGAAVVRLPINLGIGGAVQVGYRYALQHGARLAIRLDGDGQHDAAEVARLLEPIVAGRADMTIGSRWLGRGDYVSPAGRRAGMRMLARIVRWQTGADFTDTTSGFRAVGRAGLELFAAEYPVDFPEVESLVMAVRRGLRVEEVPVRMSQRRGGCSSIAGTRSLYYMARVVVALLVGSPAARS